MTPRIWIVDDDASMRWVLERAFTEQQWQVRLFSNAQSVLFALQQACANTRPDVVLTDVKMPDMSGMALLEALQQRAAQLPVIVMTAHSDLDSAVSAFKGGAFEYLAKPFDLNEAVDVAQRAVAQPAAVQQAPEPVAKVGDLIGEAPALQEVFRAIGKLSHSNVSVLITGPSGTGKELVARALHKHSSRAERAFVALNMAAIPAELIESELFGHAKGAFTGAMQKREGRFSQAHGGTLFLDEIGDMPVSVQTRLLRVLAEGQFYPIGSHHLVKVDVRILAATHQNLQQAVADGRFREDLYHRLNVIHLRLPPLAERREDIPALTRHFLHKAASELQTEPKRLSQEAQAWLVNAPWPGNIRQLENTCRWLVVMAPGAEIRLQDLPKDLLIPVSAKEVSHVCEPSAEAGKVDDAVHARWETALEKALTLAFADEKDGAFLPFEAKFNQTAMQIALKTTGGHRQRAAKLLGWGRNTLTRKLNS